MVAPPVQDFDGAFQTMVVSEASTSPATFSRTVRSRPTQRTLHSNCARANTFGRVHNVRRGERP